jgi:hypothetical protein
MGICVSPLHANIQSSQYYLLNRLHFLQCRFWHLFQKPNSFICVVFFLDLLFYSISLHACFCASTIRSICLKTRSRSSWTYNNKPRVTPRMSPTIPHVRGAYICKNSLRKEGIEPPRTSFKPAPYPICLSLHKILVKQLCNFVKVKLQANLPYIFMVYPSN